MGCCFQVRHFLEGQRLEEKVKKTPDETPVLSKAEPGGENQDRAVNKQGAAPFVLFVVCLSKKKKKKIQFYL